MLHTISLFISFWRAELAHDTDASAQRRGHRGRTQGACCPFLCHTCPLSPLSLWGQPEEQQHPPALLSPDFLISLSLPTFSASLPCSALAMEIVTISVQLTPFTSSEHFPPQGPAAVAGSVCPVQGDPAGTDSLQQLQEGQFSLKTPVRQGNTVTAARFLPPAMGSCLDFQTCS